MSVARELADLVSASPSTDANFDNGTFVIDVSTDRVGIGSVAPGATLDVAGSAIFNEAGGDFDFRIEGDADTNLFFVEGETDQVGIGTNTPTAEAKFEVVSSDATTYAGSQADINGICIRNDNTTNNNYAMISFMGQDGNSSEMFGNFGMIYTDHSTSASDGSFVFCTQNNNTMAERVRITNDGKIGIGTTVPATLLEVSYAMSTETAPVSVLSLEARDTGGADIGAGAGPSIDFRIPSSTSATKISSRVAAIKQSVTDANDASHLVFYTSINSGAAAEKMRITYDGKVGIGVTAPKTLLTVEGTLTLKEQAAADADTTAYGQIWVKNTAPNSIYFTGDTGIDQALASTGKAIAMAIVFGG